MSVLIKAMTLNLRMRTEKDGKNCFDFRKNRILEVIANENPDVIGFQEATDGMLAWLKESLVDYVVLGHGRKADYHGEGTPIAYRRSLFDLHRFEEMWLSYTPDVSGSRIEGVEQSKHPRVMAYAELIHKDAEKPFVFCNVHTDHKGERARVAECMMVMQKLSTSPWKFVLTGDFNDRPDNPSICVIRATADTLGTVDATENIVGSLHLFTGEVKDRKIDYIFTNLPTDPTKSYAVEDHGIDGVFYSDHLALCAWIEIF
jgi:endonuclease/exonuclease/phosphatase family metal-dependent hydrolase